jgi:hypothetical protein
MRIQSILRQLQFLATCGLVVACAAATSSPRFSSDGSDGGASSSDSAGDSSDTDAGGDAASNGYAGSSGGSSGGSFSGSFATSSGGPNDDGAVADGAAVGPVDVTPSCDSGIAVDGDARAFAESIGICKDAEQDGWGLVSASYQNAFGSSAAPAVGQWGLLPAFGSTIKPREGSLLGVLSSGYAREWDDAAGTNQGPSSDFVVGQPLDGTSYPTGKAPPGYPVAAQGCPQDDLVNDMIDVKLVLKAPPDASGFQFDFDFFSSEWPDYVCSNFNDAFVAYLTSSSTTGNISFDSKNNPVAVNIAFLDRCTPGAPVGCLRSNGPNPDAPLYTSTCSAGSEELLGTGYGDTFQSGCDPNVANNIAATQGASTGWLTTTAPIQPGEQFTLELMIWDAGDGLLDSSVLVDKFQWLGGEGTVPTVTQPAR